MGMTGKTTISLVAMAVSAAMVTPAMANRCGGSLAVDAPVSLAEIARRCNVNLSALYEANPGVDPRRVTPGTYLAIPDESDDPYAPNSAPTTPLFDNDETETGTRNYFGIVRDDHGLSGGDDIATVRDADAAISTRARVRDLRRASADPVWLSEATAGGQRSASADRMSYQQRSAMRIHNAGVPQVGAGFSNAISATPIKATRPVAEGELISCATLKNSPHTELRKVRKIISTPDATYVEIEPSRTGGLDCALISATPTGEPVALTPGVPAAHFNLPPKSRAPIKRVDGIDAISNSTYRLPDYNAINPSPRVKPQQISITGNVVGEADGCLVLQTDQGASWALAAAPGARSLVGKHVTAWGVSSVSGSCGTAPTLVVSHAVFAEPWTKNLSIEDLK